MTTINRYSKTPEPHQRFRLPDPPQREPDEMTQYDTRFKHGDSHALAVHLGNPESTLVEADRWIVARPEDNKAQARRPDLLVAFGVDPEAYRASKAASEKIYLRMGTESNLPTHSGADSGTDHVITVTFDGATAGTITLTGITHRFDQLRQPEHTDIPGQQRRDLCAAGAGAGTVLAAGAGRVSGLVC